MSYPYPQDRRHDARVKGEQPYKDARKKLTENEAEIAAKSHPNEGPGPEDSDEARIIREEAAAEERFSEIAQEREHGGRREND